jgi:hypothetical protein
MIDMRRPWLRLLAVVGMVGCVERAAAAEPVAADVAAPKPAALAPAIAGNRAGDYVGQNVTIEGRVAGIHESPLATVLAFAPNFAGFTATILAADREKFPSDLAARVRDRTIRVSGTVTAYRGKPEMALRDPSQLVLAPPPGPGAVNAPASTVPAAATDGAFEEIRRVLARIESRLQSLEGRMSDLEQVPSAPAETAAEPRAPALSVGTPASEVERLLGRPLETGRGPNGETLWGYGRGRSITFDGDGRVSAWSGF